MKAASNGITNQLRDLALQDRGFAISIGSLWIDVIAHEQIQLGAKHADVAERLQQVADAVMMARRAA